MKKVFDLDGGVYHILSRMYDLMIINLLILLFSLPILTIGSAISTAVHVLRDVEAGKVTNLFFSFTYYFRREFRQSSYLFLGSMVILTGMIGLIYLTLSTPFQFFSLLMFAFMSLLLMNLLTTMGYQEGTLKQTITIALGMSLNYTGYFCLSLACFVVGLLVPILLPKLLLIWLFFGFSVPLYVQISLYQHCMKRFKSKYQEGEIQ